MRPGAGAGRELLDGLRHVDLVQPEDALAHHAVLKLTRDGGGRVEQALHAFHQARVGRRVDGGVARGPDGSGLVELLLRLQQHQRGGRRPPHLARLGSSAPPRRR